MTKNNINNVKYGVAVMMLVVIVSKISSFISQWFMGIYLLPDEFGIIAIISVSSLIISGFSEVGLNQKILENRDNLEYKAKSLLISALLINGIGVFILVFLMLVFGLFTTDKILKLLVILNTLLVPLQTVIVYYKAILNVHLRFNIISKIEVISIIFSNLTLILALICKLNIYSITISQYALNLILFSLYRSQIVKIKNHGEKFSFRFFKRELPSFTWLSITSYAQSFSIRGDYLAISLILSKSSLGLYFFGFQLVASIMQLLSVAINAILLPFFSSIKKDIDTLVNTYLRSVRLLSLFCGFLCLSSIMLIPYIIELFWRGKWNSSIIVCQLILIAMPMRIIANPLGTSILDALGNYKIKCYLTLIDGLTVAIFVYFGAKYGDFIGAAMMMMLQRISFGSVLYYYATTVLINLRACILLSIKLIIPYYTSVLIIYKFGGIYEIHHGFLPLGMSLLCTFFISIFYLSMFVVFNRKIIEDLNFIFK